MTTLPVQLPTDTEPRTYQWFAICTPPRASPRRSGGACGVGDKRDALFPAVEKKDDLR